MKENKKPLSIEEIKKCELNVLLAFADFCSKNNLKYYLAYGTLLGAVRHKGFIPWDDDIDLVMPRADYNRFIELTGYNPIAPEIETRIYRDCRLPNIYPYVKVIDMKTIVYEKGKSKKNISGIWIDVFPLDGFPEKQEDADALYAAYKKLRNIHDLSVTNTFYIRQSFIKKVVKAFFVPFIKLYGTKRLCRKIDLLAQTYSYDKCKAVADFTWADNSSSFILKEELEPAAEVEFEGHLFKAPGNYKAYLTRVYGDYMQLPPESERIPHGFKAYFN